MKLLRPCEEAPEGAGPRDSCLWEQMASSTRAEAPALLREGRKPQGPAAGSAHTDRGAEEPSALLHTGTAAPAGFLPKEQIPETDGRRGREKS